MQIGGPVYVCVQQEGSTGSSEKKIKQRKWDLDHESHGLCKYMLDMQEEAQKEREKRRTEREMNAK